MHDLFGRFQAFRGDFGHNFVPAQGGAGADSLFGTLLEAVSEDKLQDLLYDRLAAAAGTGSSGAGLDLIHSREAILRYGIDNGFFGHAVAAADNLFIRHRLYRHAFLRSASAAAAGAHNLAVYLVGHLCTLLHQLLQIGRFCDITEQNCSDNRVVFEQNLLVGPLPFIFGRDDRMLSGFRELTG
ncbi:hypothetical protein D3C74_396640 [compost metagenome]